jgi:Na+/proline symporter
MVSLAFIMVIVIGLFLYLGGLLHLYGAHQQVAAEGDKLFPELALHHMPPVISVIFIIALISALFPSADGAMTALTSSFCIDILDMQQRTDWTEAQKKKYRQRIHLVMAFVFLLVVMIFEWVNNQSMIGVILKVATYTYGPLLGLYSFGIFTKRRVHDVLVPVVCVAAPLLCLIVDIYQSAFFGSFQIGLELLIINGLFTYLGLWLISEKE